MIDMTMGDEQFFDGHAMLLRHRHQLVDIATRIGKSAAHGFRAPQQGAILLQRGDGHDDGLERRGGSVHAPHLAAGARGGKRPRAKPHCAKRQSSGNCQCYP
jgi:hypothetical protein